MQSESEMERDRYDAEGVALIKAKLAAIQRKRVELWRLGRVPRSQRSSLHGEQISLAWHELAQLRFALAKLADHLRLFREQRQRNEQRKACR